MTKHYIASFDIDAQNCFTPLCPDELPVPEGDSIVAELNAQAKYAQFRIGSKDAHPVNALWVASADHPQLTAIFGENMDVRWKKHAVPGTFGFQSLAGLPHPSQYDFFVWKGIEPDMHPYGECFHDFAEKLSTGLCEFLREQHISTLIVGGLATDYCVKTTVLQLLARGFHVIVNLAAIRGIAADTTQQALTAMQQHGAIFINNSTYLPEALKHVEQTL